MTKPAKTPRRVRHTLLSALDLWATVGPFVLLALLLLAGAYWLLNPTPPHRMVLATGIAITTFQRRPEIVGVADAPVSTTQGDRWFMRVLRLLVHYPSYILYAALLGYLELYLVPYVVVNLLYAAYAVTGVTLKYARG